MQIVKNDRKLYFKAAGLTQVQSELSSLNTTVTALNTTVGGISTTLSEVDDDITDLATGLAAAQSSIASLTAQLENFNGNQAELNTISSTLAIVAADVRELLNNSNAVINSNLIIENEAQLLLAESLIDTRAEAATVIVNGYVEITFEESNLTAEQRERTQAIVAKISTIVDDISIRNTVTPETILSFPNLTFVDGDVDVEGTEVNFPALQVVSRDVMLEYGGDIHFPALISVGNDFRIQPSALASVTSLDLSRVNIGGVLYATNMDGSIGRGVVSLSKATRVNVGTAYVRSVGGAEITEINLGHRGPLHSLVVNAPKATTINIDTNIVSTTISILPDDSATINFPNLIRAGGTVIHDSNELNMNKLTGFSAAANISSEMVNIPELSTNTSGTLRFSEATTLDFPNLIFDQQFFTGKAETLTFKSGSHNRLMTTNVVESITILGLANTTNFDTSIFSALESLTVSGTAHSAPTTATLSSVVTITGDELETISVQGMLDQVLVRNVPEVTSVRSTGNIRIFTLFNAEKLKTVSIGHDHINGSAAAEIIVESNAILTSLDLSSVSDVKTIRIVSNAKLASIMPPNKEQRVESVANVLVILTGNNLSGTYRAATAAVSATDTTAGVAAIEASISQASVYAFRNWIEAHVESDNNTPTFYINIEKLDSNGDGESNGDYQTVAGADGNNTVDDGITFINILEELALVNE